MFVSFINLFMIPLMSIYLYYRTRSRPLKPCLELLCQYCMAVPFNFALAKFLSMVPALVLGSEFSFDSAHYTIIALFCAWLLPKLYLLSREIRVELHVTGAAENRRKRQKKTDSQEDIGKEHETAEK